MLLIFRIRTPSSSIFFHTKVNSGNHQNVVSLDLRAPLINYTLIVIYDIFLMILLFLHRQRRPRWLWYKCFWYRPSAKVFEWCESPHLLWSQVSAHSRLIGGSQAVPRVLANVLSRHPARPHVQPTRRIRNRCKINMF